MDKWHYGALELCWYPVSEKHAAVNGLVWSNSPTYCAASVTITDDLIIINQTAMHGLVAEEHESLLSFLKERHPNLEVL